jgi:hypothetical protein
VKVPTGEKKKGFFGGEKEVMTKETRWKQTGWSSEVDGERLSEDIVTVVTSLNQEGYEVVAILPVISGNYFYRYQVLRSTYEAEGITNFPGILGGRCGSDSSYGFGGGYSYTEGVSIIVKKFS